MLLEIDMLPDAIHGINYTHMNIHHSGDISKVRPEGESNEPTWVCTEEGGGFKRGHYKIQAISIEQQQSDSFRFVIKK
jgi:hypothetical protein